MGVGSWLVLVPMAWEVVVVTFGLAIVGCCGVVTLISGLVGAVAIPVQWMVSVATWALVGVRTLVSLGAGDVSAVEQDAITIRYLLLPF